MPSEARRLAAMVDGPQSEGRSNPSFRKDFAAHTKALFESFGAPLPGMADAPFADLLRTMAAFPTYSLGNQSLIAIQRPGATTVSSSTRWTELGRRLVSHAQAIHIWAPADPQSMADRATNGYARPSLDRAVQIAHLLGLRATQNGEYLFDAQAIAENALWGGSHSWRGVRAVRITDGGDHVAVKLILKDGRSLDRRARTMIGLVKTLMQSGTTPNDETITAYLNQQSNTAEANVSAHTRDFFQKFKLVPVYEVSDTDGPELPEPAAVDHTISLSNLITYLATKQIQVIAGEHRPTTRRAGEQASVYIDRSSAVQAQLAFVLESASDILSDRRAKGYGRELLKAEREAIKFVLATHFDLPAQSPELGYGLAPNVEPYAAAEVVKARLVSIHELAKELVLAASPNYENPLLKALCMARAAPTPAPAAVVVGQPESTPAAPAHVAPKLRAARPKKGSTKPMAAVAAVALSRSAAEDFNPFAAEMAVEDGVEFNPFAEGLSL